MSNPNIVFTASHAESHDGDSAIRGPFPLLVTPWTEGARLDTEVLVSEAEYVAGCGVGGIIWPPASEVLENLSAEECEAGLRALARWAAARTECSPHQNAPKRVSPRIVATSPGRDSAEALDRARAVQRIADETGAKMGLLARMPDDAADQAAIEAHYRALAGVVRMPVIIQTYNDGKSPQPDVALLVRLACEDPSIYGYVKEESPGGRVNARMAELLRHQEIKTVFSGFGAKAWMFQGTKIGTDGVISQRPAYASLFVSIYRLMKEGRQSDDPELADLFCKYLYMCNLGDTFSETDDAMRGPHLYVLQQLGIFRNLLTRNGDGSLCEYAPSEAERREIEQRMRHCGLAGLPPSATLGSTASGSSSRGLNGGDHGAI